MDVEDDGKAPVRPKRAAIMSDVGRLAGVSHQTVSRVINGSRHVSPQTRERVLAAMHELGYRPNSIARALVKEPKVLLADEPTGNLDEDTRDEIIALLEKLWRDKGLSMVMVTHDSSVARRALRLGTMRNGKLTVKQKVV